MSFFRLTLVLLALGLVESSCSCGRAPVTNTLKAEGEACANDEECESSLCDKLPGKALVCFRKCATVCKAGDLCSALANNDRFACVPEKPGLCQGCALNVDCPYPGDRCLEIGGTKVCSRDCSFDGQCPSSYRCADGTDTNGAFVTKQCQPTSGTCECTAASAGQTTPCQEANAFGTCNGVRTCRPPNGYEACTAPVPTSESCNGRDDDCNGMSDENLGETTCGTGECRRTVSNCINGSPQTCEPLARGTEVCDEKDNNCDGVVDDGFDKMTSLLNCGTCNTPCVRPHATPVCLGGLCGIGACLPGFVNADGIDSNGCELMCTPTGVEICDGLDNDCNGVVDDGFSTVSDLNNCGQCGRVCNVNNGHITTYACVASACGITTCTTGYADCDQAYANGCELSVSANVSNCGACNNVCTTPNATPACVTSACAIGTCNSGYTNCDGQVPNGCEIQTSSDVDHCGTCPNACPDRFNATRTCVSGSCGFTCNAGFVDLDGVAGTGCEFSCTPTGVDDPDDNSTDQNCDGIDGDESRALFVALTGNDLNPGTKASPKRTVQNGIDSANTTRPHVYVSEGVYTESLNLRSGISVYGGYSASNNWARNSGLYSATVRSDVTVNGRVVAASGLNITAATRIAYLTLRAGNASGASASSYGLHCVNCTALTMWRTNITAGAGANGANGSNGTKGADGNDGTVGSNGSCDSTAGAGGPGGTSSCGRAGGRGGNGGPEGNNRGQDGDPGSVGGTAGTGGNGCSRTCGGCDASDGTSGGPGAAGANGSDGNGGILASVATNFLVCQVGANGTDGAHGNGGGGGGGGGGQGGTCVDDGGGNGGGGGGAGGCGGTLATGGGAGGSSIAVFLVNSTGAVFQNCTITSGTGGIGGTGGTAGAQGIRGTGRGGGTACSGSEVGLGGAGAEGGSGGRGGHGGGGMGGYSFGIYRVSSTPTVVTPTYITGTFGVGGGAPVSSGANGLAGDIN